MFELVFSCLLLGIVLAILASIVVVVIKVILHIQSLRSHDDISSRYSGKLPDWHTFSACNHLGDDVGDAFLERVGSAKIYRSEDILALASCVDVAGVEGSHFLQTFTHVPNWVDLEKVSTGIRFQRQWISTIIQCGLGAIMESFGHSNGANILIETNRLSHCGEDVTRRLIETASFNLDIIEHGLYPGSHALETIARVRLLHCMVRKHMRTACASWWDVASMGCPVSQQDGVHTLFLNSHFIIRAMEYLGVPIDDHTKDCISMVWAYVGYLLGIQEAYLPKTYQEEVAMYQNFLDHSFHPSSNSIKLVNETLRGSSNLPPFHFNIQQQSALARMTMLPSTADALQLAPVTRWQDRALVSLFRVFTITLYVLRSSFGLNTISWELAWIRSSTTKQLKKYCGSTHAQWRFKVNK